MYLQEMLEVVIGVIFAWMLLSIAVLQIQEIIASYLEKRSSDLEMVIRDMLNDKDKVKKFYDHPLIRSLSKPTKLSAKEEKKAAELESQDVLSLGEKRLLSKLRQRPSYIPSSNFASALFDIVIDAGTENSLVQCAIKDMRPALDRLQADDREKANAIVEGICQLGQTAAKSKAGIEFQEGVKDELKKQISNLGLEYKDLRPYTNQLTALINSNQYDLGALFKSELVVDQLRVGGQALLAENPKLGQSINSLLVGIEEYAGSADKALALGRKNVEDWFNSTMDRLSGWYKRWAQVWAFVIGFSIALLFNVDSLYMAQQLWRNPATRLAAATYIQNYVQTNAQNNIPEDTVLSAVQGDIQKLNFPMGWKQGEIITAKANEKYAAENFTVAGEFLAGGNTDFLSKATKLFSANGPAKLLFFTATDMAGICVKNLDANGAVQPLCYEIKDAPRDLGGVLAKLAGCLITALAALQGAPFWFDTLKKIVNVRSTGANPIEKPKQGAAPAQA
jgi:hypothetical protein